MAVQNYLTNYGVTPGVGNKMEPGANAHEVVRMVAPAAIAAADDDGSTFLLFKNVPSSFKPVRATIMTAAITGGTDYDIGVYNPRTGAAVTKDLFVDGQTYASASRILDGLSNVSLANLGALKSIAELLGLTASTALPSYDIVLTCNTIGSGAGDTVYILEGFAA
jgi:hypothetical protein